MKIGKSLEGLLGIYKISNLILNMVPILDA